MSNEQKLESLKNKLQAYKVLPQNEYKAIGEHLLPQVIEIIEERDEWKRVFEAEQTERLLNMFIKIADENKTMEYQIGNSNEIFVITAQKKKV